MRPAVIVHPAPDLDACVCAALAGAAPEDVHFLPAGTKAVLETCPCCGLRLTGKERLLDHPLGEKGRLDADGTRHAAAAAMPEAVNADPDLIAEVEEQDSTGRILRPRFSLARILVAIRAEARERGLRDATLDREVVAGMGRVVRGLNLLHAARIAAREHVARVRIERIGDWRIALLPPGEAPSSIGIVLNEEHDVSAEIYRDGRNLGVRRYPDRRAPDLRRLAPHIPGWFVHSAGFLACWGNCASPETTPPPVGTPQSGEELLALVKQVYGE